MIVKALRVKDLIAAVALLIFSIVMYIGTNNLQMLTNSQIGSDFAPRLIAIGLFILSAILLVQVLMDFVKASKKYKPEEVEELVEQKKIEEVGEEGAKIPDKTRYINASLTMILIAAYVFIMPIVGFLLGTIAYLMAQFCLLGDRKYWNIPLFIGLAIVVPIIIYYTFRVGFELRLPAGWLG
ncbi:tripartite tricarboxylate transporter TctB family protein [Sinobaca sp. H24]|uniref:tripartite tricarboxylate transporter TctB family protein n=1 Tax=Sinobaca sp. H24 TaxID=2923376 RepID=UPI00207AA984|nr:tripartite tricarboxylate transporter TctB family protein [Sinobaca sp. H24]